MADAPQGGMEKALSTRVMGVPAWALGTVFAVLMISFFVYRNHKAGKQPQGQGPNDQAAQDNASGQPDPNAVDPATGLTYGQEGQQAGYPSTPLNQYLAENPTNAAYPVGLVPQGLPGPVTNQQWARLAADQLLGKGDDPTLVESALSKYIAGQQLTAGEQAIIDLALRMFGSPPEGVKAPVTPGGGGGSNTGKPAAPTGLTAGTRSHTSIQVHWDATTGADGYEIWGRSSTRSGWKLIGTNIGNTSTSFTQHGLRPRHSYGYHLNAFNSVGRGPASNSIQASTT